MPSSGQPKLGTDKTERNCPKKGVLSVGLIPTVNVIKLSQTSSARLVAQIELGNIMEIVAPKLLPCLTVHTVTHEIF